MILIYYCVGDARIACLYAVADRDARIARLYAVADGDARIARLYGKYF